MKLKNHFMLISYQKLAVSNQLITVFLAKNLRRKQEKKLPRKSTHKSLLNFISYPINQSHSSKRESNGVRVLNNNKTTKAAKLKYFVSISGLECGCVLEQEEYFNVNIMYLIFNKIKLICWLGAMTFSFSSSLFYTIQHILSISSLFIIVLRNEYGFLLMGVVGDLGFLVCYLHSAKIPHILPLTVTRYGIIIKCG